MAGLTGRMPENNAGRMASDRCERGLVAAIETVKCRGFDAVKSTDRQIGNHRSAFIDLMIISSLLMGNVTDATHPECESAAEIEKLDCRQV